MKLYLITTKDEWAYDDYDVIVVYAKSKNEQ